MVSGDGGGGAGSEEGEREREWGDEMRKKEWERYHLRRVVGPSHLPRVIMALIAEDQRASA